MTEPAPPGSAAARHAEMLGNRLRKTWRRRARWARRLELEAYRVYDRDIPEVPLAIDWYAGHLHIAAWERRRAPVDPVWLAAQAAAAAAALEVPAERVFTKVRRRMAGDDQYERFGSAGQRVVVSERGHRFLCNLTDYLDTGLFLDHRETRRQVASEVAGRRFLNLFCYTASFTVYAARAGARATTSIDLSNTYLAWARENLAANRVEAGEDHRLLRDDVLAWLPAAAARRERYDVVVVDPPTWSTSKRMGDRTLDVQRDQVELLQGVLRLVPPGGVIWFSTNQRTFRLAGAAFDGCEAREMTRQTRPDDFREEHRPHRCWRAVRHGAPETA